MVNKTEKDIALEKVVDKLDALGHALNENGGDYGRISESYHYIELGGKPILELREAARHFLVFMPYVDVPKEFLPVIQEAEKAGYKVKYNTLEAEHPRNI